MSRTERLLLLGGLGLALIGAPALAQAPKLGVVDAQSVSENTEMGRRIQAELLTFTEKKEGEIAERQKRVAELRQQLRQQALSLSAEKRSELEKDIQRHELELRSYQEAAGRELELEYGTATKAFQEKLVLAIQTFGKDEGFTIILDRSQVAYFDPSTDVTSAIVDRFNRMFPGAEPTPPAAP